MKLGAHNMLAGSLLDVRKDTIGAAVQVDIGGGDIVTFTITPDTGNRLGLEKGKAAWP